MRNDELRVNACAAPEYSRIEVCIPHVVVREWVSGRHVVGFHPLDLQHGVLRNNQYRREWRTAFSPRGDGQRWRRSCTYHRYRFLQPYEDPHETAARIHYGAATRGLRPDRLRTAGSTRMCIWPPVTASLGRMVVMIGYARGLGG